MLRGNVPALLELLALERIDDLLFLGRSPEGRDGRVYGGQVAAQAVLAAAQTIEDGWPLHSLHGYFLRPADPRRPLLFMVESTRTGRSFATRRVVARQEGRAVFSMDAGFQQRETGLEHASSAPSVPGPEALKTHRQWLAEFAERNPERAGDIDLGPRPFDFRWTPELDEEAEHRAQPPEQFCWFRLARPPAPSELARFEALPPATLQAALLVYASDHTILDTALRPHWGDIEFGSMQVASLDHALWLHADVDTSEWLLFAQDAPSSAGARGYSRGEVFTRDGRLVASVMQESLMRERKG